VLDDYDNEIARFTLNHLSLLNSFYTIESGVKVFRLYSISKSHYDYVLIYLDDIQVGQINKNNLRIKNNKNRFVLYLLDEQKDIADLMTMFIIYLENYKYATRGEISYGTRSSWGWSYSKNNKFYDPTWTQTNFGTDGNAFD